ncbi:MAG TPA: LytTR family DNA-binding domain-containing protein [Lysobacter sp.]
MSSRLRAVVADDESISRARLCRLLGQAGGVDVVAECADGDTTVAAIRRLRPSVAFLDVRMPMLTGFGVLEALPRPLRPSVVFVTAYADHALAAFDADAADYLLKPYSAERLQEALLRVRRELCSGPDGHRADHDAPAGSYTERLAVPFGARLQLLAVDEINCVLAQSNYIELCVGTQRYRLRETMGCIEAKLDPRRFLRVHRSRLVRLAAIRDIELMEDGRYLLRLHCGLRVSSGSSYRDRVRTMLGLGGAN